jgi:hypothetical protein
MRQFLSDGSFIDGLNQFAIELKIGLNAGVREFLY